MRNFLLSSLLALVLAAGFLVEYSRPAAAQDQIRSGILVADLQAILREASAVRGLQEEIERRRRLLEGKIRTREEELRDEEKRLVERRSTLADEDFAAERSVFEAKIAGFQKETQESKLVLDRLYTQSMAEIQDRLIAVVREIAEERNAELVLSKATIVLVRPALEITEQALRRLNQTLPAVTLPEPQKAGN